MGDCAAKGYNAESRRAILFDEGRCQALAFRKCLTPSSLQVADPARNWLSGTCQWQVPDIGCDNSTTLQKSLKTRD
jgi:hypothetical protein